MVEVRWRCGGATGGAGAVGATGAVGTVGAVGVWTETTTLFTATGATGATITGAFTTGGVGATIDGGLGGVGALGARGVGVVGGVGRLGGVGVEGRVGARSSGGLTDGIDGVGEGIGAGVAVGALGGHRRFRLDGGWLTARPVVGGTVRRRRRPWLQANEGCCDRARVSGRRRVPQRVEFDNPGGSSSERPLQMERRAAHHPRDRKHTDDRCQHQRSGDQTDELATGHENHLGMRRAGHGGRAWARSRRKRPTETPSCWPPFNGKR